MDSFASFKNVPVSIQMIITLLFINRFLPSLVSKWRGHSPASHHKRSVPQNYPQKQVILELKTLSSGNTLCPFSGNWNTRFTFCAFIVWKWPIMVYMLQNKCKIDSVIQAQMYTISFKFSAWVFCRTTFRHSGLCNKRTERRTSEPGPGCFC